MMTAMEFALLSPRSRGYAVYMCGCRGDEPNVPAESNPYPLGSMEHDEWNIGARIGVLEAQDSEE